jgi:hypothetical protein
MCVWKKNPFGKVRKSLFFLSNAKIIFARNKGFSVKVLYFLIWRLIIKIIFAKMKSWAEENEKTFVDLNNCKNL